MMRVGKGLLVAAVTLLLIAALGYGGACAWFAVNARSFVFLPMARSGTPAETAGLGNVIELRIATEDGERLYGWRTPPASGHGAILILTGKGVVISDYAGLFRDLAEHGFGVLGIDYRGNGASSGRLSETGLRADARAGSISSTRRRRRRRSRYMAKASALGLLWGWRMTARRPACC